MIITRTPFRISFFGGGTDYPDYYREHGGTVLSTTINKYCYITCRYLPPFFDHKYRIRYTYREEKQNIPEIKHPSVRECLKYMNIEKGIEMVHTSDIPAQSGIGSSSAFTVGFINALYALKGKMITKRQLARDSIHLEQNILKENVGSQDQVAAAFGGFNKIEFGGEKNFYVYPLTINDEKLDLLHDHLMLVFTGLPRNASDIAEEQIKKTPSKISELKAMREMVEEAVNILDGSPNEFREFGKLLHESWKVKRSFTHLVSTSRIDDIYENALRAGALGGKLLGAGGGGFMLFFVPKEDQARVKDKLKGLLHVPFKFENLGSQVVLYAMQDFY
jgi:D-glycero-alpha-D-manno-heptose-7-phosphate kinase